MDFTNRTSRRIWLAVYLLYLVILTLSPFRFSLAQVHALSRLGPEQLFYELVFIDFGDMFVNLLLFLPLGFLIFYFRGAKMKCWPAALLAGGLISLLIEITQLFLDRSSNPMDIAMNAAGSALGFFTAALYRRCLTRRIRSGGRGLTLLKGIAAVVYGAAVIGLFLHPQAHTSPDDWRSWYPLVLGNEAAHNRPWEGDLFRVSIFSRALKAEEIRNRFQAGPDSETGDTTGLAAEYRFDEGGGLTVHDVSGVEPLLNLAGDAMQWIPGGGVHLHNSLLESEGEAAKITDAVRASGALTVEVWCRPGNLTQGGPARIVSVSPDENRRNFCLAQEGRAIHLRYRSEMAGNNGSFINLRAENALQDTVPVHLTATVCRGAQQLYVNGRRHPDVIYGHVSYLPEMLGLAKKIRSVTGQILLIFCIFFPAGILVSAFRNRAAWFSAPATALVMTVLIDAPFVWGCGVPVCARLHAAGLVSALLGVLVFSRTKPGKSGVRPDTAA